MACEKFGELKAFTNLTQSELANKKEGFDKTQQDIKIAEASITNSHELIEGNEGEIKTLEKELEFWRLKK